MRPILTLFRRCLFIAVGVLITSSVHRDNRRDDPDPDVQKELKSFSVADGFEVTLFAAEPMVVKPIQMNWDADGRLWVVSSTAYPHLKTGEAANDKIYVLEDTDGDGKADKSTIFAEGLLTPTGILPGDGGVYVANATEILHLMDTDGDGKADKKRRILNGFGTADAHHLIHTFRWGPEGILYFNQSIYIYSHVETPAGVKRLEGGGVWKLNPKHLELDIYAKGLINPWGLQFDRWGQSFLTDGAGGEGINYAFPGATFVTSPGAARILRGLNPGQPKHSGLDVISGRHLPESWRGSVITNDFRANRINRFKLQEQGSGYASTQAEDLLWTDDIAFRPVDISVGPDGAIYVADWYNPIIQHGEVDFFDPRRDQQHGRIWRIVAKNRPLVKKVQWSKASVNELLEALKLPEDWTRSQVKQVLKARGTQEVMPALQRWVQTLDKTDAEYEHNLLEALWVYQTLEVVNEPLLLQLLQAKNHQARAAALRALELWQKKLANVPALLTKAVTDEHPQVRMEAVIALRNVQTADAARTALSVLDKPMDEFLDFALWQTVRELEPLWATRLKAEPGFLGDTRQTVFALKAVNSPEAVSQLAQFYKQGNVPADYRKEVLNSIATFGKPADLTILFDNVLADKTGPAGAKIEPLMALEEAARRGVKPTGDLTQLTRLLDTENDAVTANAIRLIGLWNLTTLNGTLVKLARTGEGKIREAALGALALTDKATAWKLLTELTGGKNPADLRLAATTQLATVNATEAARIAADLLRTLPEKDDASPLFSAFFATKQGTRALADALSTRKIPESRANEGRQLMQPRIPYNRRNEEEVIALAKAFEASGGVLLPEKMPQELTVQQIAALGKQARETADPVRGEMVFRNPALACMNCHAIGGAGGRIGPDLSSLGTSSPTETIARSILYPNQSIKEGFELQRVARTDGSELLGYLVSNGTSDLVLRDVSGAEVSIPKIQVRVIEKVPGSLMPSGLTASLSREDFMNLVSFLSKMGESGPFRVPTARFVRRWNAVAPTKELAGKNREESLTVVTRPDSKAALQPVYSKVSGELPIAELPVLPGNAGKGYSLVRFNLEVLSGGTVSLLLNRADGLSVLVDQKPGKLTDRNLVVKLPAGMHTVTVAVDRTIRKDGVLSVQLQETENAPAQTRLVMDR